MFINEGRSTLPILEVPEMHIKRDTENAPFKRWSNDVPLTNYEQFGSINERATHGKLPRLSLNGRQTGCVPVTSTSKPITCILFTAGHYPFGNRVHRT